MARMVCELRLDRSGLRGVLRMVESLSDALDTAECETPIEIDTQHPGGVAFAGDLIVSFKVTGPREGVLYAVATPTVHLPLFAAEICRMAPGIRVMWIDGWPIFRALDDDDDADCAPDPVAPELVVA